MLGGLVSCWSPGHTYLQAERTAAVLKIVLQERRPRGSSTAARIL